MARAIVGKWGRTLAVRISADVAEAARLQCGAQVDIQARNGPVVIQPLDERTDLERLFAGKTAQEWRAEYAGAFDWGAGCPRAMRPPTPTTRRA